MKTKFSIFLFLILFFTLTSFGQDLPRSTPEKQGIESQAIINFVNSFNKEKHENHSYMIIRHGKVVAEGWWAPYSADIKHTMYSISKSWTSTGIGLLVDQGKLNVNDPVLNFFPEYKSLENKPYLKDLRVKDLLTMSVGNENKPILNLEEYNENWVKGFLESPIIHQPGSNFLYNSMASYMLSAIVTKITGLPLIDFLKENLFKDLNIENVDWETDGNGINVGGWGIRVKTEDMAKLGLLYLNKGVYNGKRILSENWVKEATSAQIMQEPNASPEKMQNSDWVQGYGYQFWRCRFNAFRGDGAFGQYIIMLPEKDAVVILTTESIDLQDEINMVWEYLLPGLKDVPLAPNPKKQNELKDLSLSLNIPKIQSSSKNVQPEKFFKTYHLEDNFLNIQKLELKEKSLTIHQNGKIFNFPINSSEKTYFETEMKGPYMINYAKNYLEGIGKFKVASEIAFQDEDIVKIKLHYYQSPHHWIWTINKKENTLKINQSFEKQNEKIINLH
jgi:CubicO group peptidase (beta-lactamase class C family)